MQVCMAIYAVRGILGQIWREHTLIPQQCPLEKCQTINIHNNVFESSLTIEIRRNVTHMLLIPPQTAYDLVKSTTETVCLSNHTVFEDTGSLVVRRNSAYMRSSCCMFVRMFRNALRKPLTCPSMCETKTMLNLTIVNNRQTLSVEKIHKLLPNS